MADYLERGLSQYDIQLSELWRAARTIAYRLEHRDVKNGYEWVRSQLSNLRRGYYVDGRGAKRGIAHSVQRDLYRLIVSHPNAMEWRREHGVHRDQWWFRDRQEHAALRDGSLQQTISALIDPRAIPLLAATLAEALFADNVVTKRQAEAERSIAAALRRNGQEMAWNAAAFFSLDYAANIEIATQDVPREAVGHNVLGAIALALWEN